MTTPNSDNITVALDLHGSDSSPQPEIEGIIAYLQGVEASGQDKSSSSNATILAIGLKAAIDALKSALSSSNLNEQSQLAVEFLEVSEVIAMDEHPADAIKRKPNSSIVQGVGAVKAGTAQAFFSAGSTGAVMTASVFGLGRIKGVARPAIAVVFPTPLAQAGKVVLCDAGANADVKPEYVVQFAKMAAVYAQVELGVDAPKIGLLNIGAEETKGTEQAQAIHQAMKAELLSPQYNFIGNAEGGDIFSGKFDVIATDGFSGNIALKTTEGSFKMMLGLFKQFAQGIIEQDETQGQGAVTALKQVVGWQSSTQVGGSALLGVNGNVLIGHGSSSATDIAAGITSAVKISGLNLSEKIAEKIQK